MNRQDFLKLSTHEIREIVSKQAKPKVGVFIPDGNRRLVLAMTDLKEGGDEFFRQVAITQASGFLENLKVFFGHGLSTLFSPLFSRSVLQRGESYRRFTVLETLRILFTDPAWLEFFDAWKIRVKIYGDLDALAGDCSPAITWAQEVEERTRANEAFWLCLGIGGEPYVGNDVLVGTLDYLQCFGREPTREELIEFLYGRVFQPADFVIVSSKFAGVGAFPGLVSGKDTRIYYLPAPGIVGLTERTYRKILYDILFVHGEAAQQEGYELTAAARQSLRDWYENHLDTVIGLGRSLESVWMPVVEGEE
jgi:adenosine tuberculosinyltransferase